VSQKQVKADRAQKARETYAQAREAQDCAVFVKRYFEMLAEENARRTEMFV